MKFKVNPFLIIYLFIIAMAILALTTGCSPVKQVLKDTAKMREVWEAGVLKDWCTNDSVYTSDTIVTLDTLHLLETSTDTITVNDTVRITKTEYKYITKTVTIKDTTIVTDNSRINLLQKQLIKQDGEIIELDNKVKQANEETKQARKERNKWRLYFFILLGAFGVWIFRKPIMKLIKPL